MKKLSSQLGLFAVSTALCSLTLVATVNAATLQSRLGGLVYYDPDANLTWVADANLAQTSSYDADGRMTWAKANTWATSLEVAGITGWRLPHTISDDDNCSISGIHGDSGYNCTGSEMPNLFYNVLGNTSGTLSNTDPFSNIKTTIYWSSLYTYEPSRAWVTDMGSGTTYATNKMIHEGFAWAVQTGDIGPNSVSPVPVPAAIWLFGSGLMGLIGFSRRKRQAI